MSNINDFLKLIDENAQESVKVFVPSALNNVECKLLTVPQQKEVIKSTLNGVRGNITLPKVFNRIILENIKDVVPTLIDRNPILIQLRTASLGTVIYDDKGDKTDLEYDKKIPVVSTTTTITDNGITVDLKVPDLKKDNEYFTILEGRTYDNAGDIVNDLYLFEAAKFVERVEFQGEEAKPNVKDSIVLVHKLPLSLNDKILKFIKTIKDYENQILTAKNGSQITLNARFFNTTE